MQDHQTAGVADLPAPPQPKKRRPRRAALALLCLLVIGSALAVRLSADWQQTARREAYLPDLEAQVRRTPNPDGPLLALLGGRLAEAHDPAAADILRRAAAAGENRDVVWLTLAATTAAEGDVPRALGDLQLGKRATGNTLVLQQAETRLQSLGPHPIAVAVAAALCPEGPEPLVRAYTQGSELNGLADWWGHHHSESSGFATRQAWASAKPNDAQAQRLWGEALVRNRRLQDAGEPLRRALALAPHSPAAHLALADALAQGGLFAKAGLEYITALQLRPHWLPALLGLGRSSLNAGLKYAGDAFRRATEIDPQNAEAWIGLGSANLQFSTDVPGSLIAFRRAAQLDPGRTDYYADYASSLQKNGAWAEGETILRRRLLAAPTDAQAHYRLAQSLMKFQATPARLAEAKTQVREALRLSPDNPQGEALLGELLLHTGRVPQAVHALHRSLQGNPYQVSTMRLLAGADARVGQTAEATTLSARAEQLYGWNQQINVLESRKDKDYLDPHLHQRLVALYTQIGDTAKAQQEQSMVSLLQKNPQGTAQDITAFRQSLSQILGTSVGQE